VKNLAANCKVSKEDRLRFIRDLDSNKEVSFGVLINLDGGFPDKEKDYKFHIRLKKLNRSVVLSEQTRINVMVKPWLNLT
jgi:hypothetical protein